MKQPESTESLEEPFVTATPSGEEGPPELSEPRGSHRWVESRGGTPAACSGKFKTQSRSGWVASSVRRRRLSSKVLNHKTDSSW